MVNTATTFFHVKITNFLVHIRRVSRVHNGHIVHLRISRQGQWWNPETTYTTSHNLHVYDCGYTFAVV